MCIAHLHFPLPFISKNVSFSHSRLYQCGLGVVVRISILCALDCADLGESSLLKVAKVLLSTTPVCVDDWQARYPTLVDDVAATLKRIIDAGNKASGIFHVSSPERTTKYQALLLMQDILKADASHVIPDKLPCGSMKDILNADASHAGMPLGSTPRPENVQLDTGATWATLG